MSTVNLSRLEQVDLRQAWTSEAGDFTPWLAREENLALLGDAIGIELQLETTEKNVGPFRADILCKDTASGNWVLIENQLERTDHTHLGQLITYAAGLNAVTIVWVAANITDEHRAALDWLNEVTSEKVNFFGLEIELWRIGNSPMAPKFNIVSKPNDWSKIISGVAGGKTSAGISETQQIQLEYWRQLAELLHERKSGVKPQKPLPQSWAVFAIGRANFWLEGGTNSKEKRLRVSLVISGPDAKTYFQLLKRDKEAIEAEVGSPLEWNERPDKPLSVVMLQRTGMNPLDRNQWPEQHEWLMKTMEAFHRVFRPRVRVLNAEDYEPEESGDYGSSNPA